MRRVFFIFLSVAFLLRAFMGDAMAVAMAHEAMNVPASAAAAMAPDCHDMAPSTQPGDSAPKSSGTMDHSHCQLCCAVIGVPATALLTFDRTAYFARPVGFTASFASNDPLPAFKPPIL